MGIIKKVKDLILEYTEKNKSTWHKKYINLKKIVSNIKTLQELEKLKKSFKNGKKI